MDGQSSSHHSLMVGRSGVNTNSGIPWMFWTLRLAELFGWRAIQPVIGRVWDMLPKETCLERAGPRLIGPTDLIITVLGSDTLKAVQLGKGSHIFSCASGNYNTKEWIGKPFGSTVYPGNTNGTNLVAPLYLLYPTPQLWTRVLRHRTQILYLPDISLVCTFLEISPGMVVMESGTGSGSLSHSIARAVYPKGKLHTFEYHAERAQIAQEEFESHGLGDIVNVTQRDIEVNGFPEEYHSTADALFLDLPRPWLGVPSASACLKDGGRFCSFSPCIEQIQKTANVLRKKGFIDLRTMECLLRDYNVRNDSLVTDIEGFHMSQEKDGDVEKKGSKKRPRIPNGGAKGKDVSNKDIKEGEGGSGREAGPHSQKVNADEDGVEMALDEPRDQQGEARDQRDQRGASESEIAAGSKGSKEEDNGHNGSGGPGHVGPSVPLPRVVLMKGHTGYLLFARKFVSKKQSTEFSQAWVPVNNSG